MKFDCIVGNPPYSGTQELHQQFFNLSVERVVDDGHVIFIQPATAYFNKKSGVKKHNTIMVDNIKRYRTSVKIITGDVFDKANIFTSLSITSLQKTISDTGLLIEYEAIDKIIYKDTSIDYTNMIGMNPMIYKSLKSKLTNLSENGNLLSLITENHLEPKLYIQKIRGTIGESSFFTIISRNSDYWNLDTSGDYGLRVKNQEALDSLISYLKTDIVRFGLSIYKFNGNNHRGEFKAIPLVPFDRHWNDTQLMDLFDINTSEYNEIQRCIPKYYY